ncbi:MAG: DUF5723 family protein [candidate division WOR-3 bacterium]
MAIYLILTFFNYINLFSDNKVYYQILGITLNFYNNAFSGKDYNYYNGKYLNENDKKSILKIIPKEGLKLSGEAYLSFLFLCYHFWNLDASFNLRSRGRVEKEIFDLIFFGNKLNQVYQSKESKGEIFAFSKIKNGFAFSLKKNWKLGFGISYLEGYYYLKTENNYLNLLTTQNSLNFYNEINYKKSFGGRGFGFDIGLGRKINEKIGLKIIIENLGNRIFWQKENRVGKITLIIDSLNFNKISTGNYYSFTKEEKEINEFFNDPLPTEINFSLENKIKEHLKIEPAISWAIKEFFKFSSELNYQPFNFLLIIPSLNLYLPISKDIFLESFSYEVGFGLGINIKKFNFLILQEYYKGILLNAKGFSFKLYFGYNFFK